MKRLYLFGALCRSDLRIHESRKLRYSSIFLFFVESQTGQLFFKNTSKLSQSSFSFRIGW